nr:uncharacterized protein LOC108075924 [Drosophila kikkawai]
MLSKIVGIILYFIKFQINMDRNNRAIRPWPRRNPDPEQEEPNEINARKLRIFIFKVYLCAAILCLLSAIPWICVSVLKPPVYSDIPVPPFMWLIITFVLLTVLSCAPQTPVTLWLCWGLVLGSLFFITLFGCYFVVLMSVWVVVGAMGISVVLLALLHLYGAKAPMLMLPNMLCTCAVMLVGFITLFVLLMMSLFTNDGRYVLASAIVFFIIVIFLAPFQASFICGRLQQVPYGEVASCANGIYMHFCFLATCLMIFASFTK